MANRTKRTAKKRAEILEGLTGGLSISAACKNAGLDRSTAYRWRKDDAEFEADWESAIEAGTDALEDAMLQKALKMEDSASVTAGIFLLKGRRPEKYAERRVVKHSGKVSQEMDFSGLSDEELEHVGGLIRTAIDAARAATAVEGREGPEKPRSVH